MGKWSDRLWATRTRLKAVNEDIAGKKLAIEPQTTRIKELYAEAQKIAESIQDRTNAITKLSNKCYKLRQEIEALEKNVVFENLQVGDEVILMYTSWGYSKFYGLFSSKEEARRQRYGRHRRNVPHKAKITKRFGHQLNPKFVAEDLKTGVTYYGLVTNRYSEDSYASTKDIPEQMLRFHLSTSPEINPSVFEKA